MVDDLPLSPLPSVVQYVAFADVDRVRLYKMQPQENGILALQRSRSLPQLLPGTSALAFSGDSTKLVAATRRGVVQVVDLASNRVCCTIDEPAENARRGVKSTGFAPLATGGSGDADAGVRMALRVVSCSPDGRWCVAAGLQLAWLLDLQSGTCMGHLPPVPEGDAISAVAFTPCSTHVAVATAENRLLLYHVRNGTGWAEGVMWGR